MLVDVEETGWSAAGTSKSCSGTGRETDGAAADGGVVLGMSKLTLVGNGFSK